MKVNSTKFNKEKQLFKTHTLFPVYIFISLCVFTNSFSQEIGNDPIIFQPKPDSPILERHSSLTGEGEAFDFLIGDWDVVITWHSEDGNTIRYRAKWHNHWIIDGRVVMQEWRGPTLTGAEFRYYDKNTKSWTGRNIYADGAWRETKAKSDGNKLEVIIFSHNQKKGDFLNRETYFNISEYSFEMKSDISHDDGKTWSRGDYDMVVTRTLNK